MRRDLGAEPPSAGLAGGDGIQRGGGAEVLEVDAAILVAGELGVTGHHRRLGDAWDPPDPESCAHRTLIHGAPPRQGRVFLVQREHAAREPLVLECLAQHPGAPHRQPVVGEAECPLLPQLRHLGQLLALQPARDGREEAHGYARVARRGVAQRPQQRGRVQRGVGVGHGDHGAVPARRSGRSAGVEVLLVLLARGTQVDVGVEERG